MVGGRTQVRVQLQRVKQEDRIRENVDSFSMVVCLGAVLYIGCHLIWWMAR